MGRQTAATGKDAPFQAAPHAVPNAVERRSKPHLTPWGEAGKDLPRGLEGRFQALWKAGVPEERGGGRGGKGGKGKRVMKRNRDGAGRGAGRLFTRRKTAFYGS
ncbi:MAG: hypothetical protein MdMp014T_2502 [Treponematales bacterium]